MEEEEEFLDLLRELEIELFSRGFNKWIKKQSDEQKKKIRKLRTNVSTYRSQLETNRLKILADKLEELSPEFTKGVSELQKEIDEMNDFIAVIKFAEGVIGVVSRIVI